jgi:phosphoribosylamine--glycine ligase
MKILVVGSGAREHALAWKLSREPGVSGVVCAPGNAGTRQVARQCALDVSDPAAVLALAEAEAVDLTVIGPELPLALGVQDLFAARGRLLFGPSRVAAQLESSKAFAKDFMARHQVPTARFRVCERVDEALAAVAGPEFGFPVVVKADGLAAGKGVTVAADRAAAEQAVREAMLDHRFGEAGHRVVIEERLVGEEASFFAICDGRQALALPTAEDHKRAFDGDAGPNTGGMGAFAPSPRVTPDIEDRIRRQIVDPVLNGLAREGHPFRGFLYVGLMISADGPRVIEFNVRLGDPEAQVVLPMIRNELAPLLEAAARGALETTSCDQTRDPHVGVVLASGGYPGAYEVGAPIAGLDEATALEGVLVFHAGTAVRDHAVVTTGGRVLTVVGYGVDFAEAIERAYAAESRITFARKQVRTDIGHKALQAAE